MDNEYNKLIAKLISRIANGIFDEETDKLYSSCQSQSEELNNEANKAKLIEDIKSGKITSDTRKLFDKIAASNISEAEEIKETANDSKVKVLDQNKELLSIEEPKPLSGSQSSEQLESIERPISPPETSIHSASYNPQVTTYPNDASIYSPEYENLAISEQRTPITLTPIIGDELDQNIPYDDEVTTHNSVNNFPYSREASPTSEIEPLDKSLTEESKTRILTAPNPYTSSRIVIPGE